MKIIAGKYPEEKDIDKWVGFINNGNVNIVFLWRYAAYCRDVIKAKNIADVGLRDTAEQKVLYDLYLAGKGNIAAAPGTSWHEYGFAIDLNRYKTNPDGTGQYYGTVNADYTLWLAGKPETLNQYGLSHAVKGEIWHIQPIETIGVGGDKSKFADSDDYLRSEYKSPVAVGLKVGDNNAYVGIWQAFLNSKGETLVVDNDFGGKSEAATNRYKKTVDLPENGIVDIETVVKAIGETLQTAQSQGKIINDRDGTIAALTSTGAELVATTITQHNKIIELQNQNTDMEKEIVTTAEKTAVDLKGKGDQIKVLEDKLGVKSGEYSTLFNDIVRYEQSIEKLNSTIAAQEKTITELEGRIKTLPATEASLGTATLGELIGAIWTKIKGIK